MPTHPLLLKRLESGYWHARWSAEIWAQWPCNRPLIEDDFFHHTGTRDLILQVERLIGDVR